MSAPGWYPDPAGSGGQRYWDGQRWAPQAVHAQQVVTGPNHVLHLILTILTFWFFGGWIWVWLIVALSNKKRIQIVHR
ncbi:hypothetical protein AVT30_gp63 [Mycobacterium phage UnionJack]|uniref:DUF2510 domain-containing protein n=1 Tax=Mycobacterium phage UnionJack TaxID=1673876 RepID=A0A0K1LIQ2_9CAUD|nr:hypothetical protein AVT30_gp63 [Mycobacterium phage UnionJack]AKU42382.1 hypothetical protein UNIONJACK_30 [Mycobacterium phage UnionJack]